MFRNYILAALRNMRRYRVFTAINILGLAIGLSVCMIIIMSVAYQLKSDRFNSNYDHMYRVISSKTDITGLFGNNASTTLAIGTSLEEHTAVEQVVKIRGGFGRHWVGIPGEQHIPLAGLFADKGFVEFFQYPMIKGDPTSALTEPFSVIITRKAAEKLYGSGEAMGKILDMGELGEYTITGILDLEGISTHLEFEAIASLASAAALEREGKMENAVDNWGNVWNGWVYLRMDEHADPAVIDKFVEREGTTHLPEDVSYSLHLQSVSDIKPGELMGNEIGPFMPWIVVYILGGLGLLIMVSSCFNYVNLSVARSMSRSREVGIRKVNGAGKKHVICQFLVESVMSALVAMLLASCFLIYLEPAFEALNFASKLKWELSHDPLVWLVILLFTAVTGLAAGIVPSVVMSRFQPLQVIKGIRNLKVFSHVGMRKLLIVVQFSLSLFFIISIMIFYSQVEMMMQAKTGFNSEDIILVPYEEESYEAMRNEITQQSWSGPVARSSHIPATGFRRDSGLGRKQEEAEDGGVATYYVDDNYLENMGISLIAGRMLRSSDRGNEQEVVLNEESLDFFGFENAESALDEVLYTVDSARLTIVGVISDYHHDALMTGIEPLVLRYDTSEFNFIQVNVDPGHMEEAKAVVGEIWKKHRHGQLAEIGTMQDTITEFYDLLFGDLISILLLFAVIATVISCLGLLGIAIYTTELRMKEVSIRKVLGAGEFNLVYTLSWGFLKLVLLATLISVPIAYMANNFWLNLMAVKISMSPWFFIAGSVLLIGIALITIGSQTIRSLQVNPAEKLRNE